MPDAHVDFMLRQYRSYLQERMHESGRLTKGTFNEIASDMNREFKVTIYERGQVAAKLQNLKTQFRQKKACVESGGSHNEVESHWKVFQAQICTRFIKKTPLILITAFSFQTLKHCIQSPTLAGKVSNISLLNFKRP